MPQKYPLLQLEALAATTVGLIERGGEREREGEREGRRKRERERERGRTREGETERTSE